MTSTTLTVRMDSELKAQVDATAKALGLTSAAAFNVFARQFVAAKGFPFPVTLSPTSPSEREFAEIMDTRFHEVLSGKAQTHELLDQDS